MLDNLVMHWHIKSWQIKNAAVPKNSFFTCYYNILCNISPRSLAWNIGIYANNFPFTPKLCLASWKFNFLAINTKSNSNWLVSRPRLFRAYALQRLILYLTLKFWTYHIVWCYISNAFLCWKKWHFNLWLWSKEFNRLNSKYNMLMPKFDIQVGKKNF